MSDVWKTALDADIDVYVRNEDPVAYKNDKGKTRLDLVPTTIIEAIGEVMTDALRIYTEGSWRYVEKWRFRAAAFRHWLKYMRDPRMLDDDSGLPHLYHVATNIAFLIELEGYDVRD